MFYDRFESLCKEKGIKPSKAADEIGINRSSVTSWKNSGYTPQGENLQKIAQYFDVSTDYLLEKTETKKLPTLTAKDERDISKKLNETLKQLEDSQTGLMFDGEPLDDITKELLVASLRNGLEMGKKLAKQKYTPKKYRK